MAFLMTACDRQTVYSHFEHTPVTGWERNDTLTFSVDALVATGRYEENLGLRINGSYPFMQLNLIVQHTVYPSMTTYSDTVCCRLIDKQGNAVGRGVGQYQYTFPVTKLHLLAGDKLHITVRHDMKREILPGITDVGIQIVKVAEKH